MKRILLIRYSAIGDIVLCSPVIKAIKVQLPNCELHVLTKSKSAFLFEENPYIDDIHLQDKFSWALFGQLKGFKFDFIVDLQNNLRSRIIRLGLAVQGASVDKLNIKKLLLTRFKINKLPAVHIVDRYFETAKKLGVQNERGGLEFYTKPDASKHLKLPEEKYVAFSLGATYATKRMPASKIEEIISSIDRHVVLLGGMDVTEQAKHLEKIFSNVDNRVGKLSLAHSALIIKSAGAVIGFDSGLMHIASSYSKKVLLIWGNTVPEFGMGPYQPSNSENTINAEIRGLDCRPCSKLGSETCPKGHFDCMKKQDSSAIAQKINQWMNE